MNRMRWIVLPVVVLTGATALATDGVVTWHLTVDPATVSVGGSNQTVTWYSSVVVTGNNQGLHSFQFGLGVKDSGGNYINVTLGTGSWQNVYAVTGPSGKPTTGTSLVVGGSQGGPGMGSLPSTGYNDAKGYLSQCAASYPFNWSPWGPSAADPTVWDGADTWGAGLDGRKGVLLKNPGDVYKVMKGTINTSTLAPGTYTVQLDAVSGGRTGCGGRPRPVSVPGFLDAPGGGKSCRCDGHIHRHH